MLGTDKKLTGMQVQEIFLIRANRGDVILGLKDTGKTCEIVEPELGGAVDVIARQSRKLVSI